MYRSLACTLGLIEGTSSTEYAINKKCINILPNVLIIVEIQSYDWIYDIHKL